MRHAGRMARIVCPLVSVEDCARFETIVADRNRAKKHVARARIILGSADRLSFAQVVRRAEVGQPAVWRWQRRFAEAGVEGLLRDATRKPGKAPLGHQTVHPVVALSRAAGRSDPLDRPRDGPTRRHLLAFGAADLGAHDLQPHRIRTFKRSNDPEFAAKLEDIVGLYVDPPKHAVVLSVDEKSHVWMAPGSQERSRRLA
jgi:hypothetical protein